MASKRESNVFPFTLPRKSESKVLEVGKAAHLLQELSKMAFSMSQGLESSRNGMRLRGGGPPGIYEAFKPFGGQFETSRF